MTQSIPFDATFLQTATGGSAVGTPMGTRVVIDSRAGVEEALFVAIAGERFDGHDYVRDAVAKGATGVVVSSEWWESGPRETTDVLVVPDTLSALQALARAHRERHPMPMAAITGTNGKTTTKNLLAAAVSPLGEVHKTCGNLNNHIGLPLTLLEIGPGHRAAVVEIGLNHPGELSRLAGLARPQVAVITNVGEAHLEGLGSLAGVARAKAEIAEGLPDDGVLIVPRDSAVLDEALTGYSGKRRTFGLDPAADVHPERVEDRGLEGVVVELEDGIRIESSLPGQHMVMNILAALAAAEVMGVNRAEAAPGLAMVAADPGRLRPRRAGGVVILDDTYNANPTSLSASLSVLRTNGESARRWAVLGDMLELGDDATRLHRLAGRDAAFVDGLITVGSLAHEIGLGAVDAGIDPARVRAADDGSSAAEMLAGDLAPGDVVLVKGSRGMRLESAVDRLLARLGGED